MFEEFIEGLFAEHVSIAAGSAVSMEGCFIWLAVRFAGELTASSRSAGEPADVFAQLRGLYLSRVVRSNNGIKRRDVLALAKPLGLDRRVEDQCEELLGPADTLGTRRGPIAHWIEITNELQPTDARQMVADVMDNIPALAELLGVQIQ